MILFSCLILFLGCAPGEAHSFLSIPRGDYKTLNKAECRTGGPPHAPNDNCPGPCFKESSFLYNRRARNETTFRRGQQTEIVWTRNNHQGGFIRLSLVPADQRMDKTAHDKNAFWFGCFTMGERSCNSRATCGTDGKNRALGATVEIPKCLPGKSFYFLFSSSLFVLLF